MNKAKESLEAARFLARNSHFDFAASRAYYAMFYVAQALLAHLGQAYGKHAAVIAAFGHEYAKTNKLDAKYHQWLIAAQNLRNTGDYGIDAHVSQHDADTVCRWAEQFIRAVDEYLAGESGEQP